MKVLIVTTVYNQSIVGAGTFIHGLAKNMEHVHILSESAEDGPHSTKVHLSLNSLEQKFGIWSRIEPYQKAIKKIATDFDIVFCNSPFLGYRLPIDNKVIYVHDYENVSLNWSSPKKLLRSVIAKHIETTALKSCKNVITNSQFTRKILIEKYKLPAQDIQVCYLGIDLEKFKPTPTRQFAQPIKILFVKEDYTRGGLFILVEALGKLPEFEFELSLVGFDSSKLKLRTHENIWINPIGQVQNSAIPKLLGDHDLYCVPSKREALGLGNMEAMAAGTPVITTDVGGIPEVVDESYGWIATADDANSLSQQIKSCITDKELRLLKVAAAKIKVKSFDINQVAKNLEAIFRSISQS